MKRINYFILKLFGYDIDIINVPLEAKKCVIAFAPHTSMSDFIVGRMALSAMGVKTVSLIKSEVFWWPLGSILKKLGGMPVDRKNARNFHKFAADLIRNSNEIALLIAPEGTRKRNPKWKKGFYFIAKEAEVPIMLGYLDYTVKKGGIGKVFYPGDNIEDDMIEIKKFYYGMKGIHKGKFDLENMPYAHPEWL
jgi:1-acyl-sn-glycerol-3-phosphate acyltransferase